MENIVDLIIGGSIFLLAGIIFFRFFKKSKEGKSTCSCGSEGACSGSCPGCALASEELLKAAMESEEKKSESGDKRVHHA